jgi:PAS domain S-box-containing protein
MAYLLSGLFVAALKRNQQLVAEHLSKIETEQVKRREAEEQLRVLVASSPAGILTLDGNGAILAANDASKSLFGIPEEETVIGQQIASFLPVLSDALRLENLSAEFRTAAQCQGYRKNGEIFLAQTWFSSYTGDDGLRLAAIVVDSSEEMRDREEQSLRLLHESNRITAAAVSHELRNLCGAISSICSQLEEHHSLTQSEDFQALVNLVKGLQKLANLELHARGAGDQAIVPLRNVLNDLRIIIEADWDGIDGSLHWNLPHELPMVVADSNGLLQAFLNLAHNSHRAVLRSSRQELDIAVVLHESTALIRFKDSGPGVVFPGRLFQPFQESADGTGLGLYVSRAVVRSYGGDLRFEPAGDGSCFVVELLVAGHSH